MMTGRAAAPPPTDLRTGTFIALLNQSRFAAEVTAEP